MINNLIVSIDNVEKLVTDLLLYIEKETQIQFEFNELGGHTELISIDTCDTESSSMISPVEVYMVSSYNYAVCFLIYVCECNGCKKIIEIATLPFNSESDDSFKYVTKNLTQILPNIPIAHHPRKIKKPV